MRVRVVLAMPSHAQEIVVAAAEGTPAGEILQQALQQGLTLAGSGLDADSVALGVFGRRIERTGRLQDQDRLELYRPLHQDPMMRRRREAQRAPATGRTGQSRRRG